MTEPPYPYTHDEISDHVLEALIRHRAAVDLALHQQGATLAALEAGKTVEGWPRGQHGITVLRQTVTASRRRSDLLDNMINRTRAWLTGCCPLCDQDLARLGYPPDHQDHTGVECDFRWLAR